MQILRNFERSVENSSNSCHFSHVNFQLAGQFLFKFGIIFHFHATNLRCKFQAHKFSTLDKKIPSIFQILDFQTCSS